MRRSVIMFLQQCALDPIPTWLLKNMLQHIAPVLVNVINASIATGWVPELMKVPHVRPLLKKPSLETEFLKHYRPVSNLSFLSKVLEKVVAERLTLHLQDNNLHEVMHSTESAILHVTNDILRAVDRQRMTILVLLDLSAAFDTIDHERLLHRMLTRLNVKDSALNWFRSYLHLRSQVVAIEANISDSQNLDYGVPQGSVLGLLLFSIYMLPLGDLLRKLGVSFHQYTDDTQMYMSCMPNDQSLSSTKGCIEQCIKEVKDWMCSNMLKLNPDKTEFLLVGSPHNILRISAPKLNLDASVISPSAKVRNLGVILNSSFTMDKHISSVCQVANYHLRNIGMIRKYLTQKAAERAVHALITSRLDYCNSVLYGITAVQLDRLQRIQNNAACLITKTNRCDHITPVLQTLHWLPVKQRILYKILVFTYGAIHGTAPEYISELITIYEQSRTLRSSAVLSLEQPISRTVTYGDRSFACAAPSQWNKLPPSVRNAKSITCFKSKLKTHLFECAYIV